MKTGISRRWQQTLFPFSYNELPKILPLFFLFFLISFVYNLLRPLKIALVVNAPGAGAEVTAFIKGWAILPVAVLFAWGYTQLSRHLKQEHVFYCFLTFFICFFLFFASCYPNREALELSYIANLLKQYLPAGLQGLTSMIRHWDLTLFYAMSELWGNLMLTVLAWGFANECVSMGEAKRFYAILAVGADSAGIFSGQFGKFITTTDSQQTILYNMLSIATIGLIIAILYRFIRQSTAATMTKVQSQQEITSDQAITEASEAPLSFFQSIIMVLRSRYLLALTTIVIAYNMVFNLFDLLWIDQLKQHFSHQNDMAAYMHQLTSITGILSASIAFFISGNLLRRFGWHKTALVTPIVILITSIGFFSCIYLDYSVICEGVWIIFGSPLHSAIIFYGTLQYCLSRACKYTVFDSTKEMAYIPLSKVEKRQSKIIIDTLVSRGSKSGSSYLAQGLLLFCSSIAFATPYIIGIISVLLAAWFGALWLLKGKLKDPLNREAEQPAATPDLKPAFST